MITRQSVLNHALFRQWGQGLNLALMGIGTSLLLFSQGCSSSGPVRKSYGSNDASATTTPARNPVAPAESPEQTIKIAQNLYQTGKNEDARLAILSIRDDQVSPTAKTEYWNLRGLIELQARQPDLAQASFQKALTFNRVPEYRGYYQYNYASALYESNKPTDALDVLTSIDSTQLDEAHRTKIYNLKQRIQSKIPPSPPLAVTPTPASPGLAPMAPTPGEVYSGPTKAYRIGLLVPLSGKYENFGKKVQKAVELAFQNSSNSGAKNYEIIPVDSGDTPASRMEGLTRLVEQEHVIAIIGPLLSKSIEQLAEKAAYYQVPMISIAQVQGSLSPQIFSCSISNRDQAKKVIEYAMKERGYSKFAILAPSNNPGEEMANALWDEIEGREGTIQGFEYYSPESTDFREPVDKILGLHYQEPRAEEIKELAEKRKELNITRKTMKTAQYFNLKPIVDFDAVVIADDGKIAGQIIPTFTYRDAKALPYLGMSSWNSGQFLTRTQDQSEGAAFPVAFNTLNPAKTTKAFYDLYLTTYNSYPGEFDAIAFDAAAVVLKVLDRDPSTREEFREKLETVSDVEGATGEISMQNRSCSRDLAIYTVKKNKFESVKR